MEAMLVGAVTSALLPKLLGAISARKGVQEDIQSLSSDLKSMQAVLREIQAASPADQLDDDMKLHYDQAIRLTYSVEQCVSKFMAPGLMNFPIKRAFGKIIPPSEFSSDIRNFKQECRKLREWFHDHRVPILAIGQLRHPKDADILDGLHVQVKDELVKKLTSKGQLNIASIHGRPGMGKTTVAAQVYTKLSNDFELRAWVTVPTNPDIDEILTSILRQISQKDHECLDRKGIIQAITEELKNKRCFLVIDNISEIQTWTTIKSALTKDCNSSAVLTTTRSANIASEIGGAHKLEALTYDYSTKLLNQRLFGSQENCPPELKDMSIKIARQCGGTPLAIISIADFLAAKARKEQDWRSVLKSEDPIIFVDSFTQLSQNKRSCLLYLSLFRKGYEISVDRLIWGWIAEGFVNEPDGITSQNKGEEYLTEFMEKKFIEVVEVDVVGKALSCRVLDWMHEHLVASAQQNFATILDGWQGSSMLQSKVNHRLSIQGNKINPLLREDGLSHVESLVVSGDGNLLPSLSSCVGLRVFELGGCDSLQDLRGIGSLSNLKCLVMGSSFSSKIPKEIGKLLRLQTLDLSATNVKELPQSVFQISQLRRLCVNSRTKIADGIGKMVNLEELGDINISKPELLKKLCNLTKLRVLRIAIWSTDERYGNRLLKYLCSLLKKPITDRKTPRQAIQSLSILTCCSVHFWDKSYSRHTQIDLSLPKLEIRHRKFHSLPKWICTIENLSCLSIEVYKLSQDIIDTLGKLKHLESLSLTSTSKRSADPEGRFGIVPGSFSKLTSFSIVSNAMGVIFVQGAMPNLRRFTLSFEASRTIHVSKKPFDFGLENLPSSLKHVRVEIICSSASPSMVKQAEDAIRGAINPKVTVENQRILHEHMVEDEKIKQLAKESPAQSSIPVLPDTCVRPNTNKTDEVRSQITQLMVDNIHHQLKVLTHDAKVKDILRDTGLSKDEAHQLVQEARDRVKDMMKQVLEVECGPSDKDAIERLYNQGKSDRQHKQHLPTGGNVFHGEGPGAAEAHETSHRSTAVVQALSAKGKPTPGQAMAADNVEDAHATIRDKAVHKITCTNEVQAKVPRYPLDVTIGEPPSSSMSLPPSQVGSTDQSPPRFGFITNAIDMKNIDQGVKEKALPTLEPETPELKEVITVGTDFMHIEEGITKDKDTKPMRRHNKPKKAQHYMVSPQDYACTDDDQFVIEKIESEPSEKTHLVRINDAFVNKPQLISLLTPGEFLCDEVINAYIYCISATEHLQVRSGGSVFLENACFSRMIKKSDYLPEDDKDVALEWLLNRVEMYLKNDMIFIPINIENSHWYLCVINLRKLRVQVLDSLGADRSRKDLVDTLKGLELKSDKWKDLNVTTWQMEECIKSRLQTDGSSCGLWMLNFMEYFTGDNLSDTPEQVDMTHFRRKLAVILVDSELNDADKDMKMTQTLEIPQIV